MSEGKKATTAKHRWLKRIGLAILAIICAILGGSAISNFFFDDGSGMPGHLTELDKARIVEAIRLRRAYGDSLWEGWSAAVIPVINYNNEYAFLIGISNPSSGWRTFPKGIARGGAWERVPNDSIDGREYYRQRLAADSSSPQAFTVRVGGSWAASMTTKDWTTVKMGNEIRDGVPPVIRAFVPYRLIARIFIGLALNTDAYICAIGHESFHAFQGMVCPSRLTSAENAITRLGGRYPWNDQLLNDGWKAELNALADALSAKDEKAAIELGKKFLSLRRARRLSMNLDPALVNLEQQREWEEGLGKYTELALWKRAASDSMYTPLKALANDADFGRYKSFKGQWGQELSTLRLQSHGEESRFYYAGMAQGFLLDRLMPNWKIRILEEDVFLENLLNQAITLHSM